MTKSALKPISRQGSPAAKAEFEGTVNQRAQFRALMLATRRALNAGFQDDKPPAFDSKARLAAKSKAMQDFRDQYAVLKASWVAEAGEVAGRVTGGVASAAAGSAAGAVPPAVAARFSGYDAWVANANNASFAAQAAYDELVPDFEALFERISQAGGKASGRAGDRAGDNASGKAPGDTSADTSADTPGDAWPLFYAEVKRVADLPGPERRRALKSGGDIRVSNPAIGARAQ